MHSNRQLENKQIAVIIKPLKTVTMPTANKTVATGPTAFSNRLVLTLAWRTCAPRVNLELLFIFISLISLEKDDPIN